MDFSICLPHFVDCLQLFDCNATTRICVQLCFGKMGSRGICFFAKWDPEVLGHSPGVHGSLRTQSPCHHWEMKYVVAPAVGSEEMCGLLCFIIFSGCVLDALGMSLGLSRVAFLEFIVLNRLLYFL